MEEATHPLPRRLSALFVVAAIAVLSTAACEHRPSRPGVLADGSPAPRLRVDLRGVSAAVIPTRVHVVRVSEIRRGSRAAACLRGFARDVDARGSVVERIGVDGESVTLRDPAGVTACDGTGASVRWCGSSFGRLYGGRLRDPRLDLGACLHPGVSIAFAWVDPDPATRYVAVVQPGYVEVYEAAGGLPVRVTTRDVRPDSSGAAFHFTEHDVRGRLLRRVQLVAAPAG